MGFGLNIKIEAPKVEVPKVEAAAAVSAATGAVSGAVSAATSAVSGAVGAVTAAVTGAVTGAAAAASGAVAAISSVAGAIADVDVSFKGATEDFVLAPHVQLDANAGYDDTDEFQWGPIWIFIDLPPDEAKKSNDELHIFTKTGNYDKRFKICNAYRKNEQDSSTVYVEFEKAPMSELFSLEAISENGNPYLIFHELAYGYLRSNAQKVTEKEIE
jgi:hypothetical protein